MTDKDKKTEKAPPAETDLTPSGLALAKVGEPPDKASDEEKSEHAAKYQAARLKARRG